MKINISKTDYQYNGLGFNSFNFIRNVAPRISKWLLEIYNTNTSIEEHDKIADKLKKIAEIIDAE